MVRKYLKQIRFPNSITDASVLTDADNDYRARVTPDGNLGVEMYTEPYGSARISEKTPLIQLKSSYGITALREELITISGASVDATGQFLTVSGINSNLYLETNEHGRWAPGIAGEAIIGIRFLTIASGTQAAKWGYWDRDGGGVYFGQDSAGMFVGATTGSEVLKVYQPNWNKDPLDGTGKSGLILDRTDGRPHTITYQWAYGTVKYSLFTHDMETNTLRNILIHEWHSHDEPPMTDPNLPLTVELSNGSSPGSTIFEARLLARSYSIIGKYIPNRRINSERNLSFSATGTDIVPIISIRKKAFFDTLAARLQSFDISAAGDSILELRAGGTLIGASWTDPTNTTSTETAMESDTTASGISGGELLWSGVSAGTSTDFGDSGAFEFYVPEGLPISLCVAGIGGGVAGTAVLRWREEW